MRKERGKNGKEMGGGNKWGRTVDGDVERVRLVDAKGKKCANRG